MKTKPHFQLYFMITGGFGKRSSRKRHVISGKPENKPLTNGTKRKRKNIIYGRQGRSLEEETKISEEATKNGKLATACLERQGHNNGRRKLTYGCT